MSNSQNIADIAGFFRDPAGSSVISLHTHQIVAPVIRGHDLTEDEAMTGGGLRIVKLVFDGSGSMSKVAQLLVDSMNQDYVPALKAGRDDDIAALRIGGVAFSSDVRQIWVDGNGLAYHTLDQLPPLTLTEYFEGGSTALHAAIIEATNLAMRYGAEQKKVTGIEPDIDIIVLSDGANTDQPRSSKPVRDLITGTKPDRVRFCYLYFNTSGQTDVDDPRHPIKLALEMGFDEEMVQGFEPKPGESRIEMQKRFRKLVQVMSKVSASKGQSATKATAAVVDAV